MQDKIKTLSDLQKIDTRLINIEKSKEGLPEIVSKTEKKIENSKKNLEKINISITEIEKLIQEESVKINRSEKSLEEYKTKKDNVTNNKEYEALANEMTFHEAQLEELNASTLKLNKNLDVKKEELLEEQNSLKELEEKLGTTQKLLEEKLAETEKEEILLNKEREKLVLKLPKQLYELYFRILKSKGGKAVVGGDKGYCEGCYTVLPSQKTSALKRNDTLVQCDACSRVLIIKSDDKKPNK